LVSSGDGTYWCYCINYADAGKLRQCILIAR
jgi:hypothetical protein